MTDAPTSARLTPAGWFKSSYSAVDNECVEVAFNGRITSVRDSKARQRGELTITNSAFVAFVGDLKVRDGSAPEAS